MADSPESENRENAAYALQDELAELVRRSLLQIGDMNALQDEMTKLSKRMSGLTPPADPWREPAE